MRVEHDRNGVWVASLCSTDRSLPPDSLRGLAGSNGISIAAKIHATDPLAERSQAILSHHLPQTSFGAFAAYDAARTCGLNTTGYFGAVFDGRYVYFVPEQHASLNTHANVLRYDTHGSFYDPDSYCAFDASKTAGMDIRGFYGGAFDGRFVYFIPRQLDMVQYHSRLLRLDTEKEFLSQDAWSAHDIGLPQSAQSCGFDGRYLYFCPGFTGDPKKEDEHCSRVIRFDSRGDFHSQNSYQHVDLRQLLGVDAACFDGAAFDGRFIYFVPLYSKRVVRFDSTLPFNSADAWQQIDLSPLEVGMFVGAVFDGRCLYLVPYASGSAVRFDVSRDFGDLNAWETSDISSIDGLHTEGFDGGFFDGRFIYFVPFVYGTKAAGYTFHTNFVRYDPLRDFNDPRSWQATSAILTDGLKTTGYNAGAFDGRYFYCAPWQQGRAPLTDERIIHGKILRYDTLGDESLFCLKSCDCGHNGGLNAAVRGPSFLVNTASGPRSVAFPSPAGAGKHLLAARFDGERISIRLNDHQRKVSANGRMEIQPVELSVGSIAGVSSLFRGSIERIGIAGSNVSEEELLSLVRQPA